MPVPERATLWRLPLALEDILRAPLRAPVAAGAKVTLIVQPAPAATDLRQLLGCAKLLVLVPVIAKLVTLKSACRCWFG